MGIAADKHRAGCRSSCDSHTYPEESNRSARKKPDLKINIPGVENTAKAEIEDKTTKKEKTESLDSLYAQKSGKRLCPYCETLNDGEASSCCACGNQL